ncbi:MAG TPA: prepilin peptidase [Gemmatimonadaceae bacterium]|nr:prepilin peptidase [Gemmatimonadaceae bacterium]
MNGFSASALSIAGGACFTVALVAASVSDVRSRRIPNSLVLALAALGVVYSALLLSPTVGVPRALLGLAIGFGLWIPFYALRMLGAGDVKMFAAASCWLAPSQVFGAALLSALAGGVLSVIGLALAHGIGLTTFRIAHGLRDPRMLATPLAVPKGRKTLPYGLAMAIGLLVVAWFPQWLRLS